MESSADRTIEGGKKSLVSLVSSTRLKLQMEKFSEVACLVLTIEIERLFVHAHESVLEAASV